MAKKKSWKQMADECVQAAQQLTTHGVNYGMSEEAAGCYEAADRNRKLATTYLKMEEMGIEPAFWEDNQ